jgi:hypothetical protein
MTPDPATTSVPMLPQLHVEGPFAAFADFFRYGAWGNIWDHIVFFWNIYSVVAIVVSLLFFIGMIYAKIRSAELEDIESEEIKHAEQQWAARHAKADTRNTRWDVIQQRVNDNSPESWRIAIIEADILLEETLTKAGYAGQSIGDKLKSANPESFRTVQDAWDAHKVRNEIAHVGSDFVLTQRAAKETMVKFERVFKEFGVI